MSTHGSKNRKENIQIEKTKDRKNLTFEKSWQCFLFVPPLGDSQGEPYQDCREKKTVQGCYHAQIIHMLHKPPAGL